MVNTTENEETKAPDAWYGARHTQTILAFLLITIAYTMRVNFSVAIVAMTDNTTSSNPDIPTYDWDDKSVLLSSFYWGYIVLQVFAGYFGKQYGPRWIVFIAMLVTSIACLVTPMVANRLGSKGVMGIRVLQGLVQGFVFPSTHNILGKWAPTSERSRMGTFVYSGVSFGTIVSMVATAYISASWAGWPASYYTFGSVGLFWCVLWLSLGSNSPAEHRRIAQEERDYIEKSLGQETHEETPLPWKDVVKSVPLWAILVAHCGQCWGNTVLLTEIPNYLNEILDFDMESNGLLSAAPYFSCWIMCFVLAPLSDYLINHGILFRTKARKLFNTIGCWIPAAALLGVGYVPKDQKALSVALLIVAVGFNAGVICGFQVNHVDLAPNHAGILMGITNGISNIFSIVAPLTVQFVVYDEKDEDLWRIIFIIASFVYIVCNTFYIVLASGEIQYWNDVNKNRDFVEKEKVQQMWRTKL